MAMPATSSSTCSAASPAGFVHTLMFPHSEMPLIGASGAVSGVLAAYLVLFPRARVWILLLMRLPLRVPAALALVGWIVVQVISLFALTDDENVSVAWWAHIGGFATGLVLTLILRSRLQERLDGKLKRRIRHARCRSRR